MAIKRALPWYDLEEERQRNERTETIRRESIAVRIQTEQVRDAYRRASDRTRR